LLLYTLKNSNLSPTSSTFYSEGLSFVSILIEQPNANLALTRACALTCKQKLLAAYLAALSAGRKAKIKKKTLGSARAEPLKKSATAAKIVKNSRCVSSILYS
jgi:hypothetical protein